MNETEDLTLMTNLYPRTTGLTMVLWVEQLWRAPHDAPIKVMQVHGTRIDPGNLAVVALRPRPHVVAGHLTAGDLQVVGRWIALNEIPYMGPCRHWRITLSLYAAHSAPARILVSPRPEPMSPGDQRCSRSGDRQSNR